MLSRIAQRGVPPLLLIALAAGCVEQDPAPPAASRATPAEQGVAESAPQIACATPVQDFGTVVQGATVARTFTIKNTGRGVLKIDRAKGG